MSSLTQWDILTEMGVGGLNEGMSVVNLAGLQSFLANNKKKTQIWYFKNLKYNDTPCPNLSNSEAVE